MGRIRAVAYHDLHELYVNPQSANHDCSRRHSYIFFHCFSEKIRLDVSSESPARQRIHMKNQALFSSKDKSKKLKCRLLQFLFGALRVNSSKKQIYFVVRHSSLVNCEYTRTVRKPKRVLDPKQPGHCG